MLFSPVCFSKAGIPSLTCKSMTDKTLKNKVTKLISKKLDKNGGLISGLGKQLFSSVF
jgi:hypothetical protein